MFIGRSITTRIIKCLNKKTIRCIGSSTTTENIIPGFKVTEVRIPTPDGDLAGKLWEGTSISSSYSDKVKQIPIICTHGWLDNAGSFDPLIQLLIKPNDIFLAIDLPGHGFSYHTLSSQYNILIESYLGIHRAMHHFGWEKIILLGHSLGASASFIFAGIFPECVDRYISIDNFHPIPRDVGFLTRTMADGVFDLEELHSKKLPTTTYSYKEILLKLFKGRSNTITMEGCQTLLIRGASQLKDGKYIFRHDVRCLLLPGLGRFSKEQTNFIGRGIKCPVCVIKVKNENKYEREDIFLDSLEITRQNSSSRVELHLVDGTHHVHLNEPNILVPIINKFLE